MASFLLHKTVRSRAPRIPFAEITDAILPKQYELSLVLIGDTLGRKLNKEHKGRDYATNVLSFPLSENSGEIFINMRRAEREAPKYGHSVRTHIAYLFIHGALHLAGHDHGEKMEKLEHAFLKKFM